MQADRAPITILDGPTGTELIRRGIDLPEGAWSAAAIDDHADVLAQVHAEYAAAGATVHTACTFRTTRRTVGDDWQRLARRAVEIARMAVPKGHRVAGSIAPLEDCYRPELSPPKAEAEHAQLAEVLADAGCDLLLCETFAHVDEILAAVRAAKATGLPVWVALSAGYTGELLSPQAMAHGASRAVDEGAEAVLINCTPARAILPFVQAVAYAVSSRVGGVGGVGVYANAGTDDMGYPGGDGFVAPAEYAEHASAWHDAGATVVGGCCGTGPEHIRALVQKINDPA